MDGLNSNEIAIAIIGVISTIATAVFSNWDKIFGKDKIVKVKYSGYQPTKNFETELRHYFEVTGHRKLVEKHADHLILNQKNKLIQQYPEDSHLYVELMQRYQKERITFDDVIKRILPIYKDHFTLAEIQELNKFYSTESMQNMVNKNEALAIKIAPINSQIIAEDQEILNKIVIDIDSRSVS